MDEFIRRCTEHLLAFGELTIEDIKRFREELCGRCPFLLPEPDSFEWLMLTGERVAELDEIDPPI